MVKQSTTQILCLCDIQRNTFSKLMRFFNIFMFKVIVDFGYLSCAKLMLILDFLSCLKLIRVLIDFMFKVNEAF